MKHLPDVIILCILITIVIMTVGMIVEELLIEGEE